MAAPALQRPSGLNMVECLAAAAVLLLWLMLFTGGTLIDTRPYRYAISPEGVWAMDDELRQPNAERYVPAGEVPGQVVSWLIVLAFFMPVNLALVCVTAGTLGAFGSLANLQTDDEEFQSRDLSSPYVSAMLRGFFVYLFLISGLLLLDANPFADASPGQYVRLAGFLSLMSFVVNYHPQMFGQLVAWSFQRIQARGGVREEERSGDVSIRRAARSTEVVTVQTEVEQLTNGEASATVARQTTSTAEVRATTEALTQSEPDSGLLQAGPNGTAAAELRSSDGTVK